MAIRADKYDVLWRVPNRKKPIASSSFSTSQAIVDLGAGGLTLQQLRDKFTNTELIGGHELTPILDAYIQRGFGNWVINQHFR